jgi:RND family efflux transporter MFP subunit
LIPVRASLFPRPLVATLVAALTAATLAGCGNKGGASGAGGAGGPGGKPKGPLVVRTVEAKEETVERVVEITGTLGGAEEITLSAEVDGRVERIAADLGDGVQRGATIVQLNATTPRLMAEQAEADYLQALAKLGVDDAGLDGVDPTKTATVRRAEADFGEAQRNQKRVRELFGKGVVTQNDLDIVETRERVAEAALQQAREDAAGNVASARARRAALGLARKRLNDTSISSPIAGVVAERLVSLGEYVKAGQAVARVVVASPLKLRGDVPERYASDVKPDLKVTVAVDSVRGDVEGKLSRVGPLVSADSRTFRVEALVPNDDGALKPGLFARARVTVGDDETVFAIPETAVASTAGVRKVFVLDDGKASERRVDVLRKRGGDALVVGDLKTGDQIIVTAIARMFDGAEVKVDGAPNPSAANAPTPGGHGKGAAE